MSTLFTFSKSYYQTVWLYENLAFAKSGDAICLMQDAVLALQSSMLLASFVAKLHANEIGVFGLEEDIQLRGIDNQYPKINIVDYAGLVDLSVRYDKHIAW